MRRKISKRIDTPRCLRIILPRLNLHFKFSLLMHFALYSVLVWWVLEKFYWPSISSVAFVMYNANVTMMIWLNHTNFTTFRILVWTTKFQPCLTPSLHSEFYFRPSLTNIPIVIFSDNLYNLVSFVLALRHNLIPCGEFHV